MNLIHQVLACLFVLNLAASESWWQNGVIYQIYPRSFKDSNGDGNGDLKGITEKLDYLQDIGVSAIWLSPIYKSPMADLGYDISNFKEVDPMFGSMEDFVELKKKCTARGIKLLLDFVPNHSSDENEWFRKSVRKEGKYKDYYIWREPFFNETTHEMEPPNNWISVFGGSAWEYNRIRRQFYLHQFLRKQPDLNYRDANVVQEMKDVLTFWMNLGVDGFRVDAIPYLFENSTFEDEPWSGYINANPNETNYLSHIYTQNQPETYDMVHQWRQLLDQTNGTANSDRIMMLEAYASIEQVMEYYGTEEKPGAHFPFNFLLITDLNKDSNAEAFNATIHKWLDNMPEGRQPNWVIGNHDNHRVGTRYPGLEDGLNMLNLLLPGTAITYYGEEIGMVDTEIPPDDIVDMSGRDPERTPMQWDNTTSAGFSTNDTTWLKVNDNYQELNVKNQLETSNSHLFVYKRLVELRKEEVIQNGNISTSPLSEKVFSFERYMDNGNTSYLVVINLGGSQTTAKVPDRLRNERKAYSVHTASVSSTRKLKDKVTFPLLLGAKEALVLKVTNKGARGISAGILLTIAASLVALVFNT